MLLPLNVSGQKYQSCTSNNNINKFNVLLGHQRNTDSMGSEEWELARSCKYESAYDKFQTHDHNVVDLGLTIKEMRVIAKYTKDGGMFTVAEKKVQANTSALAVAITALKDLANFSYQTITKFVYANYKVGAPMLLGAQDRVEKVAIVVEYHKGMPPHYVEFKNQSMAGFNAKKYAALEDSDQMEAISNMSSFKTTLPQLHRKKTMGD